MMARSRTVGDGTYSGGTLPPQQSAKLDPQAPRYAGSIGTGRTSAFTSSPEQPTIVSESSNDSGPHRVPPRHRSAGGEEDHPLSPRYFSYRSSLATRLAQGSPSSPPPKNFVAAPSVSSPPRHSAAHLDRDERERRIAAAVMVSYDSSDDDIDHDDANRPSDEEADADVKQKLAARLGRNVAGRGWDDEAAAAGAAAAAALAGSSPSSASPVEFTVQNVAAGHGELDHPRRRDAQTPTTPRSWYSTTSSLTEPGVTPGCTPERSRDGPILDEEDDDESPAFHIASAAASPMSGTPTRSSTAPLSPPASPPLIGDSAQLATDGSVLYGVRFPPEPAVEAPRTTAADGRSKRGGSGGSSTSVAQLSSSPPPSPPPHHSSDSSPKQCVWLLLGGGTLLLITAVALTLAFLLTNGRNDGAPSEAASSTGSRGENATTSDPDLIALLPTASPSPRPPTRSPVMLRRPTGRPSATPQDEPTSAPTPLPPPAALTQQPSSDPATQEWIDSLVAAYRDVLGASDSEAATVDALLRRPASSQRRALDWLLSWHTPSELDRLGEERLLQRYALAAVYYATREGVSDSNGGGNAVTDATTSSSEGPSFGQYLARDGDCGWRSSGGWGICALDAIVRIEQRNNKLDGTVPSELGFLSYLEVVDWSDNELRGTLPTELAVLTGFSALNLRDNQLTGTVPSEYGALRYADEILLDGNDLEGTVPPAVCEAFASTASPPTLYVDCGGNRPKVSCPPGICCTYCCSSGGTCECVFAGTSLEAELC